MAKVKNKERILKAERERQLDTYKGAPVRLSTYFSTETFLARRYWHEIFRMMKNKKLKPRLLYPAARLSFKTEEEIQSFPDKKI